VEPVRGGIWWRAARSWGTVLGMINAGRVELSKFPEEGVIKRSTQVVMASCFFYTAM
jgi:hypothetical protein